MTAARFDSRILHSPPGETDGPIPILQDSGGSRKHALAPDRRLMMAHESYDPRCERIRMLRTELLLRCGESERADIIALVSPRSGEGRSLLAAELAISFAETGRPTLLVDGDLRNPHQHLLFRADNGLGLSRAIENGLRPCLQVVRGLPRMSVLTAGTVSGNPLELLTSTAFASMMEEWRKDFRFVVIDTAPATQFSDGLAVAHMAGRVLALSRAQYTPYRDMQDMLRRLAATRSQILGAVLNHF